MATSLSNLVDNLSEGICKIKCKDFDCFLEHESVQNNLIKYKCLFCYENCSNKIDSEFKKRYKNTFKFPNNNINKFILLLIKGVYPYGYMDEQQKFDETLLPEKKEFYSTLNMEDITDTDYMYAKSVCKYFETKYLGEYHDLYLKDDTLLSNNKYMKGFDKNKELSYRKYWDVSNLFGCKMLQKLPGNSFEWIQDTSQFNKDFIKSYHEENDEGYFLEVDV